MAASRTPAKKLHHRVQSVYETVTNLIAGYVPSHNSGDEIDRIIRELVKMTSAPHLPYLVIRDRLKEVVEIVPSALSVALDGILRDYQKLLFDFVLEKNLCADVSEEALVISEVSTPPPPLQPLAFSLAVSLHLSFSISFSFSQSLVKSNSLTIARARAHTPTRFLLSLPSFLSFPLQLDRIFTSSSEPPSLGSPAYPSNAIKDAVTHFVSTLPSSERNRITSLMSPSLEADEAFFQRTDRIHSVDPLPPPRAVLLPLGIKGELRCQRWKGPHFWVGRVGRVERRDRDCIFQK